MEKKYIERLFDKEREFYLRSAGAIQIVGPKRCGKSRTARRYAKTTIDLMKKHQRSIYSNCKTITKYIIRLWPKTIIN